MSQLFNASGSLTYAIAANATSGTTQVAVPNAGQFIIDNTGNVPVFVGHSSNTATANAVIPVTGTPANGFWIEPNQTKWYSTNQSHNNTPTPTWYVSGITVAGTATIYVTPCVTYP